MRQLFTSLTILAFLLTGLVGGCDKPAPSDYWAGDPQAAQSGVGGGKTFEKLMTAQRPRLAVVYGVAIQGERQVLQALFIVQLVAQPGTLTRPEPHPRDDGESTGDNNDCD